MNTTVPDILRKAVDGERLTFDEGIALMDCHDLPALGRAADAMCRRLHPEPYRTYNIDRNINYTNICAAVCDFCAFYRKSGDADAYVLPREEIYKKVEETIALGGDQTLMQGGMHPSLKLEWYEDLLRDLRRAIPSSTCTLSVRRKSGTSTRSTSCPCARCCAGSRTPDLAAYPAAAARSSSIASEKP